MVYMKTEKPIAPEQRRKGTKRYSEYRLIANVIEQEVTGVLHQTNLSFVHYGAYQAVGRYCLSTLWKLSKSLPKENPKRQLAKLVKPELGAMQAEWQNWGLDMNVVMQVQRRVTELCPGSDSDVAGQSQEVARPTFRRLAVLTLSAQSLSSGHEEPKNYELRMSNDES